MPPLKYFGPIIEYYPVMEDFLVRKIDGDDCYMYIGFTEMREKDGPMVNCSGLARVRLEDDYECWFNYSFHHSIDWSRISGIELTPNRKYKVTMEEIKKLAIEIVYNIREFISRMN